MPPVVYCDVYIYDKFYRSLSKSQYAKLNPGQDSEWEFDIQDTLQEYLKKYLAANGETTLVETTLMVGRVYCKFRSSGFDLDGFIEYEGTAPIQATDDAGAVAGTGTQSNTFYGINATLQHEDNQDLATHLNSYKRRTWDANSWPLTHRPNKYRIGKNDSDSFSILTDKPPASVVVRFKLKGSTTFSSSGDFELPCDPVQVPSFLILPNATAGMAYNYGFVPVGSAPFTVAVINKPSWMMIEVNADNEVRMTGLPTDADVANGVTVNFTIANCTTDTAEYLDTLNVQPAANCVPVAFDGGTMAPFPDAITGQPYLHQILLSGFAPMTFTVANKPIWMTVSMSGNMVMFQGTPSLSNVSSSVAVDVTVRNCTDSSLRIFDNLAVIPDGKDVWVKNRNTIGVTLSNGGVDYLIPGNQSRHMTIVNADILVKAMFGTRNIRAEDVNGTVIDYFADAAQGDVLHLTNVNATETIILPV